MKTGLLFWMRREPVCCPLWLQVIFKWDICQLLSCSHIIMCSYASFSVQVWIQFVSTGLNSILFAINIDNTDLNGQVRGGSSVSDLLKESTQGMSSLWKESTQGVSTLLREISTATAVVPGFIPRSDAPSDPLPVLPRSTSAGTCHIP